MNGYGSWNYARVMEEANKRPYVDSSFIQPDQVYSQNTLLRLRCLVCGNCCTMTVKALSKSKNPCKRCSGRRPWNYQRLMEEIHKKPELDFSYVRPEHVISSKSKLPLRCVTCGCCWNYTTISSIFGRNDAACPKCSGKLRWTPERLDWEMKRFPNLDFTLLDRTCVTSSSQVCLSCKTCRYQWTSTITSIINGKSNGNCPRCTGQIRWTLQRLLTEGVQRWPSVDFSRLREEDIVNSHHPINVGCKICGDWRVTRISYLTAGYGCPTCSNNKRWTIERLFKEVVPLFQHKYYFGNVRPEDVYNQKSPFWISSYLCGHSWQSNISKLRQDNGCPECSITKQWTWEDFLISMRERQDIDLRHVNPEDVVNARSIITWRCADEECAYVWKTKLSSLLNGGTGCPRCVGHAIRTYDSFMEEMKSRTDVDVSLITREHDFSSRSKLPFICKKCNMSFEADCGRMALCISSCPRCSVCAKWDYERFLREALTRDDINFGFVEETHFTDGGGSLIPCICKMCGHDWYPKVESLFVGRRLGCPECNGHAIWDWERFCRKSVTRPDIDFRNTVEGDVSWGCKSVVKCLCVVCGNKWVNTIHSIFYGQSGCAICNNHVRWTWERFLQEKDKFPSIDFHLVKQSHIVNGSSLIPCICKKCNRRWEGKITNVFGSQYGCSQCAGHGSWTYERFLSEKHKRLDINFDHVTPDQFNNGRESKISCRCKKCLNVWEPRVGNVLTNGSGCPICCSSRGERAISDILTQYNVPFEREVVLPSLPRKRYDFRFVYNNRQYLLEFDGEQHFRYNNFHHRDEAHFLERQTVDVLKSQHAYQNNYFLIRIDYTQIDNIQQHLHAAISSSGTYYLSNPEMYSYLFTTPTKKEEEITA